eukprot:10543075-Alexandrium_andersonii.AAC.1
MHLHSSALGPGFSRESHVLAHSPVAHACHACVVGHLWHSLSSGSQCLVLPSAAMAFKCDICGKRFVASTGRVA